MSVVQDKTQEFQEILQKCKATLQECQEEQQVHSCLQCSKVLECEVRKKYVQSVYSFLNGGEQNGGFDF